MLALGDSLRYFGNPGSAREGTIHKVKGQK